MMKITDKPLVSIAMCTYNGESFIREQIDSLIQQDYRPLEICIFDDQSSDQTVDILKEYESDHDFIKIHRNETNLGFIKNFERSISYCSGDYIALCDQDDIWYPEKISTLLSKIGDHMLIYSKTSLIDEHNNERGEFLPSINRLEGSCNRSLILDNCVTGHTCMFPRDLLQHALPFPDNIDYHDHWLAFTAATIGTICDYPHALSSYRHHANNVSFDLNRKKSKKRSKSPLRILTRKRKMKAQLTRTYKAISALNELKALTETDRILIESLAIEIRKSIWKHYNHRLDRLLRQNPDLLELYSDKERFIHRYCKGSLLKF
jgi:glycosyltransferase involved in cell wall biosynthesis